MRQQLIAGNWKMHGTLGSVRELLNALKAGSRNLGQVEVAVMPPFIYLAETADSLAGTPISWGAQNISEHTSGAYTGEVAASMLIDFDCRYVIVGHSERRALYGESDTVVAKKFAAVQRVGLQPVLCVGETLQERETDVTEEVVARQLSAVLETQGVAALSNAVIAYEPVWAIGTGKTATSEQAQQVHAFIRGKIAQLDVKIADSVRILYGGSVKQANAAALFSMPDIDGGLVGGASLDAREFLGIATAGR